MHAILIVEDDAMVSRSLEKGLREDGYEVRLAASAAEAEARLALGLPSLILLDLGLPDADGLDLLPRLRGLAPGVPILILTARDPTHDRVRGLDQGANDYIVKPFDFPELLARIRVQLRLAGAPDASTLRVGDLSIDLLGRRVMRGGIRLELPPRQYDLLVCLARARGRPVSRDQIAREVWNATRRMTSLDNLIDVHVSRLREQVDGRRPDRLLHTLRGVGYTLAAGETT
jgi:two-component system, OmpR family, copper resistance phosphate regulon response regulator CusR